ncbi:calnexin [Plasmopara halstedii]|uniref:Calnexin n=1 Tax=Plasmopara halstedii TaxID=4781 RepID=A0A0P1AKD0_PLAHL|nr:calnexin [Plasmopara halstedii]CEG41016.1 calnexin [Plasmopara halstedii]|eukprot:XP_024577385.1 calnexin [Plasmopara halstedii]
MKIDVILALVTAALLPTGSLADDTAATKAQQDSVTQTTKLEEARKKQLHELTDNALFVETFETEEVFDGSRWFKSTNEKYANQDVSINKVTLEAAHLIPNRGLVLDKPAHHYGLAVKLDEPLQVDGSDARKEMVVQYEVKLQNGLDCGGAYVKLLRQEQEKQDFSDFSDTTPFVLMFGPDKCGQDDKLHLIFQHKNPVSGEYEEKHMMEAPGIKNDKDTHLYTAVIRDDNTFEVFVDQESVKSGTLLDNFLPSVIPEKEIDDPQDSKPKDWVDLKKIRDPNAVKPDDWDEEAPARILDEDATKPDDWLDDEPAMINDPDVTKPEDWDDEDDGEFVVPQIPNPKCADVSGCGEWKRPTKANPAYKGKFFAPYIPNPAYKGEWKPRKIPNPNYFEDEHPARLDPIGALAIEVWTMSDGITFDNFWLGNDLKKAQKFAELTWLPKHVVEVEAKGKSKEADENNNDGGAMKMFETLATDFANYANANPLLAIGGVAGVAVLATLAMFFLCCASVASKSETVSEKSDSGADDDEEDDTKAVVSGEKEKTVRQRKKAPKVE